MIRGLQRLLADGTCSQGVIPLTRQRECRAGPGADAFTTSEHCKDNRGHVWHRHPCADAFTCHKCDLTYLGGPTVVVKTEAL